MKHQNILMSTNPKVTVAIPVYNVEPYVARSINSVIDQDYDNIEILVVYDKSNDNSLMVTKDSLTRCHFPYTIIENDIKKSSIGIARNILLDNFNGDYLYFLDSDDYIEPNTIELMVREALTFNADVVKASHCNVDEDGHILKNIQYKEKDIIDSKILKYNIYVKNEYHPIYSWNKLYKSSFLKNNKIRYNHNFHEDALFSFLEIEKAEKVILLPNITYNYLVRNSSLTRSTMTVEKTEIFISIRDFIYDYYKEKRTITTTCCQIDSFVMCYIMTVRDAYNSKQISESEKLLLCRLAFQPPRIPIKLLFPLLLSKRYKVILSIIVKILPFKLNMLLVKFYHIIKRT
jgi:glycosyltransferase involved in cell wall biosynthesis